MESYRGWMGKLFLRSFLFITLIDFLIEFMIASHFKRNIIYSGLAERRLSQRRWRVATRHAFIDGNAIHFFGGVLNSHECTNDIGGSLLAEDLE